MKVICDRRSEFPIKAIGMKKPDLKKIRASTGFEPVTSAIHLLTFKMYKGWLPSSSIKGIMPFLAKLVSCPVSGQLVQFPAIEIKNIFLEAARL